MSRIIKAEKMTRSHGEYVIDPAKFAHAEHAVRLRRNVGDSPEDQAKSVVDQANTEAAAIISMARQEAEQIRASAYQEGHDTGLAELEAEKSAFPERLAAIEADSNQQIEEFWASVEPELLKLSLDVARKIIFREIDENEEFVLSTVKAALHQLRERQDLKIHVNPADYEFVRERKEEITSSCDGVRSLEIIDDRRVDKGGCLIESPNGDLDGRIGTQIAEVEKALLEAAHDGRNDVTTESR